RPAWPLLRGEEGHVVEIEVEGLVHLGFGHVPLVVGSEGDREDLGFGTIPIRRLRTPAHLDELPPSDGVVGPAFRAGERLECREVITTRRPPRIAGAAVRDRLGHRGVYLELDRRGARAAAALEPKADAAVGGRVVAGGDADARE